VFGRLLPMMFFPALEEQKFLFSTYFTSARQVRFFPGKIRAKARGFKNPVHKHLTIIIMNTSSNIIGPVAVFLGLTAILSWFAWRKQHSSWQGTVIETSFVPGDDEGSPDRYYVICKTDAGKRLRMEVLGKQMMDGFKPGQRVEKKPGQNFPSLI
jgi:hypothetical protein